MRVYPVCELIAHRSVRNSFRELARVAAVIAMAALPLSGSAEAQVNVVTYHNDNARYAGCRRDRGGAAVVLVECFHTGQRNA